MACVSENSGDDGRYLNSDHPGCAVRVITRYTRGSQIAGSAKGPTFFYPERTLETAIISVIVYLNLSLGSCRSWMTMLCIDILSVFTYLDTLQTFHLIYLLSREQSSATADSFLHACTVVDVADNSSDLLYKRTRLTRHEGCARSSGCNWCFLVYD